MPATAGLPHAHAAPSRPRGPDRPAAGTIAEALRRAKHPSRSLSQLHRRTRYCGGRQNWRNSSELFPGNARHCAKKICSVFGMKLTAQCSQITEGLDDMPAAAEFARRLHRATGTACHTARRRPARSPTRRRGGVPAAERREVSQRCYDVLSIQVVAPARCAAALVTATCRASKSQPLAAPHSL